MYAKINQGRGADCYPRPGPEYTFSTSNTPALLAENTDWNGMTLTYSPRYTGVEYRAVAMIYAKDAEGISTQRLTS